MYQILDIEPLDLSLQPAIAEKINNKTKPPGSLGAIERIAEIVCLTQQSLSPIAERCELLLFAGDHGIAESGVSAFPTEVTRQMVRNFLAGGAAANVFANQHGIELKIIDTGVSGEPIDSDQLISRRLGSGTQNFLHQAAMTGDELDSALNNGQDLIHQSESPFIAFGEMGIGNTSSATMLAHKLTSYSLRELVGRGTGLDDAGLERKLEVLEQAAERTDRQLAPFRALQEYGGFEVATMCGAMMSAAAAGKNLLIDGFIATSALLVAARHNPNILDYCIFCHRSAESGHAKMLESLNARALLDLELRLGEGTGTLLAWPIVQSACEMINNMASFTDAGVSDKA